MSLIHIARNNAVLGQFTEEDVRAGLIAGTYLATDLAWRTGLPQWKPLGEWREFSAETPPPLDSSLGAPPTPLFSENMPSWERRKELGIFNAFVATTKEVLKTPDATFAAMKKDGGLGGALLYYFIPQAITGVTLAAIMSLCFGLIMAAAKAEMHSPQQEKIMAFFGSVGAVGVGIGYLVMFTVMIPLGLFISAGIQHLLLKLWGACNAPFEATFRTLAYTWGSVAIVMIPFQLLGFIPCIGLVFGLAAMALSVWGMIVMIKGLAKMHNAPIGRVIGAVLTPVIFCCCLYGVAVMVVMFGTLVGAHH